VAAFPESTDAPASTGPASRDAPPSARAGRDLRGNQIAVRYRGQHLTAEQARNGDWSLTVGERTTRSSYLDYAVAELLGVPSREAIALATKIVEQTAARPGADQSR
jgi:hypothetical protein